MATQYVDFTAISNLLEKDIKPSVEDQLYKKSILWQLFGGWDAGQRIAQRANIPAIEFKNNTIYVTTMNQRPTVGAIAVKEKFQYGAAQYAQGNLGIAIETGAFLIPKAVLNLKNEGAIVNNLQFQMQAVTNAMAMDLNRQAYGDGTATLAYASGSGTSTTTINLKPKNAASTLYNNDIPLAVRYFTIGMKIKVGSNAVTTVASVTGDNTITVDDAQTFSNGDSILKYTGSDTLASEMDGLAAMVNTGDTYMGIDGATDATWNAKVNTNSGVAKTMANSVTDLNNIFLQSAATGNPKLILMNFTEYQKWAETLTDQMRFQGSGELYGGWSGLKFMGGKATVVLDYDCPDDRIYVLSPEYLFRADYQDLEFEPGTLGNGSRLVQQLDYEIVADWMGNIGTVLRSAHGVLTNRVG